MRPFQSALLAVIHHPCPSLSHNHRLFLSLEEPKAMAMIETILGSIFLIMLLFILLIIFIVFKPWQFIYCYLRAGMIKADDLKRHLIQEDSDQLPCQRNEPSKGSAPEGSFQNTGDFNCPCPQGLTYKPRLSSPAFHLARGGSFVVDIGDPSEDLLVGQTLKHPLVIRPLSEEQKDSTKADANSKFPLEDDSFELSFTKNIPEQGNCLTLEVITGPSRGLCYSLRSTYSSKLPLILGRNTPSDLVLKDPEVSGTHAMIKWNFNKLIWELVDMGSLNGTLLNSKRAHHHGSGSRYWGDPVELASGDIITLGTTTQIHVQIASLAESEVPFGIGIASDAMMLRRGGKKLPMEDVCYYEWPLPVADQFGVFGICDGHGGADASKSASKILPGVIATILSDPLKREKVLSQRDASDVLREAFCQTEACMNYYYEGCTATVLMVWADSGKSFFAQCANVGDSACVMNIDGRQIKMTEDHRITSYSERQRINESGDPLKDGDTRLCGLNLGRMLGDKFLKEQDARFSSNPYISEVVHIDQAREAFALMASDGLWDVISVKKAIQLVLQARGRFPADTKDSAEKIANFLLDEARLLRTKDNTSIIYMDFDIAVRNLCRYDS
ncbi:hypothetical protein Dimus_029364 [Dionaea muscipula]